MVALLVVAPAAELFSEGQQLFEDGQYERALERLDVALAGNLAPPTALEAHKMSAIIHGAFGRTKEAIASFREVLEIDPNFELSADEQSPKVMGLLVEAKRREPPLSPERESIASQVLAPDPRERSTAHAESPPLYKRWWFWTAASVLVVGSTAAAYQLSRPQIPLGNLGSERL